MIQKFISVFFVLAFSANVFYNAVVYLDYVIHQEAITALFCVNKDEPEMQCNGSCHLKDQLAQNSHENEQNTPPEFRFEVITAVTPEEEINSFEWAQFKKHEKVMTPIFGLADGFLRTETPPPKRA